MFRRRAQRTTAGIPEALTQSYWVARPGDRVMTREGFAGKVEEILEGPQGGNETYIVRLDNGMGGGEYGPNEIRPLGQAQAQQAAIITAADDYPELAEVLVDRPPLEDRKVFAHLAAVRPDLVAERYLMPPDFETEVEVDEDGERHVVSKTAGVFQHLLDKAVDHMGDNFAKNIPGLDEQFAGHAPSSDDWCRFRRDSRCFYARNLDPEATKQAGYAVWIPEDRGFCPRPSWEAQQACPVSEPGPNVPGGYTDATIAWEQGGQRGHAAPPYQKHAPTNPTTSAYVPPPDLAMAETDEGAPTSDAKPYYCEVCDDQAPHTSEQHLRYLRERTAVKADPEFVFHFTAAWKDVREKAARISRAGHVRFLTRPDEHNLSVVAEVQGDTDVYQTRITRVPGKTAVAFWECGCAWSAYSWGRTGRWKRFEGRMCSHALATTYAAQREEMFGGQINVVRFAPTWRDPSILPKTYFDKNKGRSVASLHTEATDAEDVAPAVEYAQALLSDRISALAVMNRLATLGCPDPTAILKTALNTHFPAQYEGQMVLVTVTDSGHTLANGQPVDPRLLMYPTYTPTLGLDPRDAASHTARLHTFHEVQEAGNDPDIEFGPNDVFELRDIPVPPEHQLQPWEDWDGGEQDYIDSIADAYRRGEAVPPVLAHPDERISDGAHRARAAQRAGLTHLPAFVHVPGKTAAKKDDGPSVSGVALKARDTGRILMLQRGLGDEKDPAAGTWEFPGGHHEDGDQTSLHAGIREWEEEVGQKFPEGGVVSHTWRSPNGKYQGHVVVIPEEKAVCLHQGRDIDNPDDPDGDESEQVAWWHPDDAKKNPALRKEVKTSPWDEIKKAAVVASLPSIDNANPENGLLVGRNDAAGIEPVAATLTTEAIRVHFHPDGRFEEIAPVKHDRLGLCYENAAKHAIFGGDEPDAKFTKREEGHLVHGTIQGEGLPPLGHAWAEEPDGSIYEPTTDHTYTAEGFKTLFHPTERVRYSPTEAVTHMLTHKHWGPWDEEGLSNKVARYLTLDDLAPFMPADGREALNQTYRDQGDDWLFEPEQPLAAQAAALSAAGFGVEAGTLAPFPPFESLSGPVTATSDEARDWDMDPALRDDPTWRADSGVSDEAWAFADNVMDTYHQLQGGAEADLHDEPEPALPTTDGADDDALPPLEARAWIMNGARPGESGAIENGRITDSDIALAAKQALKAFTPAEQKELIEEGEHDGVTASNLDILDIAGTHYEALEAALSKQPEDAEFF